MPHDPAPPHLKIIVDSDGLTKVFVDSPSDGHEQGLALLGRVLPILDSLDRIARGEPNEKAQG